MFKKLSQRQQIRLDIKHRIARTQLVLNRRLELKAEIATIDANIDAETNRHESECKLIQLQLETIEGQRIERIIKGEQPGAGIEEKRKQLLASLHSKNVALESAIEQAKLQIKPHRDELWKIDSVPGEPIDILRGKLCGEFADPIVEMEMHGIHQLIVATDGIQKSFGKQLENAKYYEKHNPENPIYQNRARRWAACVQAAATELASLQSRYAELRERALSE